MVNVTFRGIVEKIDNLKRKFDNYKHHHDRIKLTKNDYPAHLQNAFLINNSVYFQFDERIDFATVKEVARCHEYLSIIDHHSPRPTVNVSLVEKEEILDDYSPKISFTNTLAKISAEGNALYRGGEFLDICYKESDFFDYQGKIF